MVNRTHLMVKKDFAPLAKRMTEPPAFRLKAAGNRFTPDDARDRGAEVLRAGNAVSDAQVFRVGQWQPP